MSGMLRKMRREKLRKQYEHFSKSWQMEKRYQQSTITEDGATVTRDGGQDFLKEPNTDPVPLLGKKPTFSMWMTAVKNKRVALAEKLRSIGKIDVDETEWDE